MSPEGSACSNCGAAVTGHYCANCGQRRHHPVHSVWHFLQEATEDLTHADSRVWRTLWALFFKPGFLTREFLDGRRARYLPPLRLYLVLSVVFFVIAGLTHARLAVVKVDPANGATPIEVESPRGFEELRGRPGETREQREKRVCTPDYDGPAKSLVLRFLLKGCHNYLEDGGKTVSEAFLHNVPRAMFLFLPALALVMKALYWRPPRYYVEHLLFFIHNHAFAFLMFGLLVLIDRAVPAGSTILTAAAWLYIPVYLFVSMRRVYGQSRRLTCAKLVVLSLAYLVGAAATLALTSVYSVLTV